MNEEKLKKIITSEYKSDYIKAREKIVEASIQNRLIIFTGAGISCLCGLPTWNDLANKIIDNYINNYKNEEQNYIFSKILKDQTDAKNKLSIIQQVNEKFFYEEMYNILNVDEEKIKLNEEYSKLSKSISYLTDFIVTTNADNIFDSVYSVSTENPRSFFSSIDNKQKIILHLHGRILNKESLVFTTIEYIKKYSEKEYRSFIKTLFSDNHYTILIAGYSLSELELLTLIYPEKIDNNNKTVEENHIFLLNNYFEYEKPIFKFQGEIYNQMGITMIPYIKDFYGFKSLTLILQDLSEHKENLISESKEKRIKEYAKAIKGN